MDHKPRSFAICNSKLSNFKTKQLLAWYEYRAGGLVTGFAYAELGAAQHGIGITLNRSVSVCINQQLVFHREFFVANFLCFPAAFEHAKAEDDQI